MRPSLRVHVNRDQPRSVEPEATRFTVDGPFDVVVENHGQPAHVHLSVDDTLADVTAVEEANWFVTADEPTTVPVDVYSVEAVEGTLEVATAYGAERGLVEVFVEAGSGGVDVDDDLGEIQPDTEPEPRSLEDYAIPAAFVGGGLVVVALLAVLIEDLLAVTAGILTVGLAVVVALFVFYAE
jgi:hypothetical protein